MSLIQKPIDAIRREMIRRGYEISVYNNRRDICDLLGVSRKSSMKRICSILGVEYNYISHGGKNTPKSYFLINIFKPSETIEFDSVNILFRSLLFSLKNNSKTLDEFIENQYVVSYDHKYYIISNTPQQVIKPNFDSPYMMITIRQVMKSMGYDITVKTNRKDMCRMLRLSSGSTKLDICDQLNIPYVKTSHGGRKQCRKVKLTNPYDPSHTVEFRSINETGRQLNIESKKIYTYINDQSLTVPYQGFVFKVSFVTGQ